MALVTHEVLDDWLSTHRVFRHQYCGLTQREIHFNVTCDQAGRLSPTDALFEHNWKSYIVHIAPRRAFPEPIVQVTAATQHTPPIGGTPITIAEIKAKINYSDNNGLDNRNK